MNLAVSLYSLDQSRVALLADISQEGCCLHGTGLPDVGQDVLLKAGDVGLFGQIVWKGDGKSGVEFDQTISQGDLKDLRRLLAAQVGQESLRPNVIPPEGRRQFGRDPIG
jgi:hypothetical protein